MTRLPSDHPDVESVHATLVRAGRTDRPRVRVPAEAPLAAGDVVRLVLDGTERFTPVERALSGDVVEHGSTGGRNGARSGDALELRGAYDTPGEAREPGAGTDRLPAWRDEHGVAFDGAVLVDVVDQDYRYGLRAPGERVVYDAGRPDEGLQDIAEDLL